MIYLAKVILIKFLRLTLTHILSRVPFLALDFCHS